MKTTLNFISIGLYTLVGVISLVMAYKSIFSKQFISFHEKAVGKTLDSYDKPIQYVILALMKVSGLGFLIIGMLLLIFPLIYNNSTDYFLKYSVPFISLIYCFGLFIINLRLNIQTKVITPWKGSLIAILMIITGIIISNL